MELRNYSRGLATSTVHAARERRVRAKTAYTPVKFVSKVTRFERNLKIYSVDPRPPYYTTVIGLVKLVYKVTRM